MASGAGALTLQPRVAPGPILLKPKVHTDDYTGEGRADTQDKFAKQWKRMADGLAVVERRDLPRWITEIGFPVNLEKEGNLGRDNPAPIDHYTRQRTRLRDAYREYAYRDNVKAFLVHSLRDLPHEADPPPDPTTGERKPGHRFGVGEMADSSPFGYNPWAAYSSLRAEQLRTKRPSDCPA